MTATLDTPAAAAANLATRMTTTWLDVAGQCFSVGTRYWADVLERGATPVDVLDDAATWMRTVSGRREPTWSLPNTVLHSSPIIRVRDFSLPAAKAAVPVLILPPQAGHHSCIVDYSERQSQVGVALASRAATGLFVARVGRGDAVTADVVDRRLRRRSSRDAIDHIGEPVHLVGDCQGGWLAAIYAALDPASGRVLTIGGAPIDFHAGRGRCSTTGVTRWAAAAAFYRALARPAAACCAAR